MPPSILRRTNSRTFGSIRREQRSSRCRPRGSFNRSCRSPTRRFLTDNAHYLKAVLSQLGRRFQMSRHGNRNATERTFRKTKNCTYSFSHIFTHAPPTMAERWLQIFAVWWDRAYVSTTERLFRQLIYSLSANDINSAIRVSASSRRISVRFRPSGNSTPSTARTSCVS